MVYRDHQDGKLNIIQYTCAKYKGKAEVLLGCVRQPLVSEFFWRKVLAASRRTSCGALWCSVEFWHLAYELQRLPLAKHPTFRRAPIDFLKKVRVAVCKKERT